MLQSAMLQQLQAYKTTAFAFRCHPIHHCKPLERFAVAPKATCKCNKVRNNQGIIYSHVYVG